MRSIRFLDPPFWQADAFHLVVGRKGVGKGTQQADLASRVTWGDFGPKRNVIWIASEDSAAIDIRPRLVAAGGHPERVYIVKTWVQLPRDIEALGRLIRTVGDVGLVIVDPVGNHITGKSSNADTDIRDAIAPLNDLADKHETMVIGVRHLTEKEARAGVLAAILGASAWVQVPRVVIAIARDSSEGVSIMQCVSGNRMPPGTPGRVFRIEGVRVDDLENEVTRAVWIGDSTKDVETLIGEPAGKEPSKSEVARELILDALEAAPDGRIESDELDARIARETGLAAQTVRNVRADLKNDGLIRPRPERDESGTTIERWFIERTKADRPTTATVPRDLVTVSDSQSSAFGSTKPETVKEPRHTNTVTRRSSETENDLVTASVDTELLVAPSHLVAGVADPPRDTVWCEAHEKETTVKLVSAGVTYLQCGCLHVGEDVA
jgi:AAA domain